MSDYKKLPGRGRKGGGVLVAPVICALYSGDDHLLQVENTRLSETYRRFYYRDIQGFVVRKTRSGFVLNVIFGLLLLLFGLAAFSADREDPAMLIVWSILACPCLAFLVFNVLAGTTCRTSVFTAVGQDDLGSLGRLRRARKVLSTIRPLIDAAQGPLDQQAVITSEGYVRLPDNPVSKRHTTTPEQAARLEYRGGMHVALFSIMLGIAAACIPDIFYDGTVWFFLQLLLSLTGLVAAILALVRGYDSPLRTRLSAITWTGAGFLLLWLFAAYVVTTVMLVAAAEESGAATQTNYLPAIEKYAALSANEHLSVFVALTVSAGGFAVIGIVGLALVRLARRIPPPPQDEMQPPSIPPPVPTQPPDLSTSPPPP